MSLKAVFFIIGLCLFSVSALAESVSPSQSAVHITLYQNNLALIEDKRMLDLKGGRELVKIDGVSPQMIQDSLILFGSDIDVFSRRFDFDVTTPQKLVEHSLGKKVRFRKINPATGQDEIIEATILSTRGGGIIERGGRIETGYPGTLILDQLPEDFLVKPSLHIELQSKKATKAPFGLGYLAQGMNWKTTYVLDVNKEGSEIDLKTWASLTNNSGTDFKNADLSLAAGQVNKRSVQTMKTLSAAPQMARMAMDAMAETVQAEAPTATSNVYTYPIKNAYDLKNGQTLQIALMPAQKIKSKRRLVQRFGPIFGQMHHNSDQPVYPQVELTFDNETNLPLPAGLARIYGQTDKKHRLFLGEDNLRQTPNGAEVTLRTGQSFDVSLKRTQTNFQRSGLPKDTYRAAYNIQIKNAGKVRETLQIIENFPGEWKMRSSNIKAVESTARQTIWEIELAPDQTTDLTYEVEVRTR